VERQRSVNGVAFLVFADNFEDLARLSHNDVHPIVPHCPTKHREDGQVVHGGPRVGVGHDEEFAGDDEHSIDSIDSVCSPSLHHLHKPP
jgi:hypothetical protein